MMRVEGFDSGEHLAVPQSSRAGNRRKSVRLPVDFAVRLQRGDNITFTSAADLSEGGLFVHELIPFSVGTRVQLSFLLPGSSRLVECDAEVVRVRHSIPEGIPTVAIGNGCRFLDLGEDDQVAIQRYLESRVW